jgi:hypothetical protein
LVCDISTDELSDGPIVHDNTAAETISKSFGGDIILKGQDPDAKCILWLKQRMQIWVFLLMKNVLTCWPSGMSSSIAGL